MSIETPESKQTQPIESGSLKCSGDLGLEKPVELSDQPLNTVNKIASGDASALTDEVPPELPPASATETKERSRFPVGARIAAGAAGLVLAGTSLVIGINAANSGEKPAEKASTSEGPAADEATSEKPAAVTDPESLVVVDKLPENVVTHGMFELLTPTEKKEIKAMDAMSVEEFRALPEEQQIQFAEFVYRNNLPILKYRLGQTGQEGIVSQANIDTPEGTSTQYKLVFALITSLKEFDNGIRYDFDTAKKLVVLLTDTDGELGTQRVEGIDEGINLMNMNTPTVIIDSTFEAGRIESNGDMLTTIYNNISKVRSQQTFHKESFETIDNKTVELSRTVLAVSDQDSRYIPLG